MAYSVIGGFPSQQLSFTRKTRKDWAGKCKNKKLETKEVPDKHRRYDNHIFLVYMHINKCNNKVYVGITHHVNPYKRWGYGGQAYTHSKKFFNAINKYGWDNFDHIVLCRASKEWAIIMEQFLIAHYKKLGISYNLADGWEGTNCITEENRRKLSERMRNNHPMKGKHHTSEAKAKISEAGKRRVYTEEQKEQIRQVGYLGRKTMRERGWWLSAEGIKRMSEKLSLAVFQLDLSGNIIQEFASATEADKFFSSGKGHHISDVCNGKRKTAYKYKWAYKKDYKLNTEGGQNEL